MYKACAVGVRPAACRVLQIVTHGRFTDKKLRALFDKFGIILGVKMESKFGVAKVLGWLSRTLEEL